ncbi:ribonuclease P protein component [Epilithonimonas mollis]|uniref:Ribonuclease P protein component n=1 Tax=Epilithonimonas mollis TaxID=216903 RepID=A0A1M6PYB9_9FLAO|nr:ribonuclease P protein component [Epilithonimonas mollis]SHK12938.1 ribonuclease P protein component [Epilithonimonas mollis]
MKKNGYPTQEKLKKKSEIDLLFKKGKWISVDNLRIIYLHSSEKMPIESHKIGVSVSKKFFKRAVDRNRIKRLLRECYRLNKALYQEAFGEKSIAMLFWVSKDLPEHNSIVENQFLNLCKKKMG